MLTCVCIFSSSFVFRMFHSARARHTHTARAWRAHCAYEAREASEWAPSRRGAASPWARPCRAWLLTGAAPAVGGPAARGSAPVPLTIGEPRACQVSVSLSHVAKVNRRKPAQTKVPDF